MKLKEGVIIAGLQLQMREALIEADKIWKSLGQELVVTCGLDGEHSAGSLHYYGYALDFRTNYFNPAEIAKAYDTLRERTKNISPYFDVVRHSTHIHIEFDFIRYMVDGRTKL